MAVGALVVGNVGLASSGIARVIDRGETPASSEPQLEPRVDIGDLPRIIAVHPGAAISDDARRPDGPDTPPVRRRAQTIPESDPIRQGIDGTQPDPPARRSLPAPTIAPPPRPAPPATPDVPPPPAGYVVDVPPDQPDEFLRPDAPPPDMEPDAPGG